MMWLFSTSISSQELNLSEVKLKNLNTCLGIPFVIPQSVSKDADSFSKFLLVMGLPPQDRGKAFALMSSKDKAKVYKVKLALELIKRFSLRKEQKALILDALNNVSEATYDKPFQEFDRDLRETVSNAQRFFSQTEAIQIFADINGDTSFEVNLLAKYENLLNLDMDSRKRIAKELPLNERLNLWHTQLAYHLATTSLSGQQQGFILDIIPNIPSIFEASKILTGIERAKYLETLESSMFNMFGKELAYAIFMEIGIQKKVIAPNTNAQLNFSTFFTKASNISFLNDTTNLLNSVTTQWSCNCRWYCSGENQTCKQGSCRDYNGCGPFDDWNCTGRCGKIGYSDDPDIETE